MKTKLKKQLVIMTAIGLAIIFYGSQAMAHCQIPCGIYDDGMRLEQMIEDSDTVIKAIVSLEGLQGKNDTLSDNQRVRWVMNKENHAQKIIETISDYYLTQRVKPDHKDYPERLKKHHAVILAAMKVKQSASREKATALKKAIQELKAYYPIHTH